MDETGLQQRVDAMESYLGGVAPHDFEKVVREYYDEFPTAIIDDTTAEVLLNIALCRQLMATIGE